MPAEDFSQLAWRFRQLHGQTGKCPNYLFVCLLSKAELNDKVRWNHQARRGRDLNLAVIEPTKDDPVAVWIHQPDGKLDLASEFSTVISQAGGQLRDSALPDNPIERFLTFVWQPMLAQGEPLEAGEEVCISKAPFLDAAEALERLQQQGDKGNEPPTFDPQRGVLLFTDHPSISLEENERIILKALVSLRAASLSELRKTECDSPHKILKKLLQKYPVLQGLITLPGGKGKGGYSTTIKPVG